MKKLLLVIDDEDRVKILKPIVMNDFIIESTTDPHKGLEMAKTLKPDLIILDLVMPGLSGYEVIEKLKEIPDIKDIPIIIVSSLSEATDRVKAYDMGACDFITFPYDPVEINALFRLHMKHCKYHQDLKDKNKKLFVAVKQAHEANISKSNFLANMSHELRTPLHAIRGFSNLIHKKFEKLFNELEKLDDPEILDLLSKCFSPNHKIWKKQVSRWLYRINDNQNRQLNLVNDLLDLAKLESGKTYYNFKIGDLLERTLKVLERLQPMIEEKSLSITIKPSIVDTRACFDRKKIGRVIENVIGNAVKFAPKGGNIGVCIDNYLKHQKQEMVKITIKDDGIGIPENELNLVFDQFFQSSITKTGAGGTGLGLPICREIIKAHNGSITVKNAEEGGAVFTITLPRRKQSTDEDDKPIQKQIS